MKESEIRTGRVVGTLAAPDLPTSDRLVLILHGLAGHRDYCYQRLLGQKLADSLGVYTFRFDFRSCGDSDPVPNPQSSGRTVYHTDFEDISEVVNHFESKGLVLFTIVGHSRGFAAAIYWTIRNGYRLPCLVNCSGRCEVEKYAELTLKGRGYDILIHGGHYITARRYGNYSKQWIPLAELISNSTFNSRNWSLLSENTRILSIFGAEDRTVPPVEGLIWAAKFQGRHTLEIVGGADHNFYGPPKNSEEKKHTYAPVVVDIITRYLEPFLTLSTSL